MPIDASPHELNEPRPIAASHYALTNRILKPCLRTRAPSTFIPTTSPLFLRNCSLRRGVATVAQDER